MSDTIMYKSKASKPPHISFCVCKQWRKTVGAKEGAERAGQQRQLVV